MDIVFVDLIVVFFLITWALAIGCRKLEQRQ